VDYVQDAVAESLKEWRAGWVEAVLGNDEAKKKYADSLPPRYVTLEAVLSPL
jgi:hypothetical protein